LNRIVKESRNKNVVREAVSVTEAALNSTPAVNIGFCDAVFHIHLANI